MLTHFGPFQLNEQTRELLLRGEAVSLQPRVFDVLAYLIRHRDRVVGKEELLNTLWPDVIVTDASLQRAISLIRTTLRMGGCDDAIQTRARMGYRFSMEEEPAAKNLTAAVAPEPFGAETGTALLERGSFLKELGARFLRAQGGEGEAVFIVGEAGIGKSSLLAAFLAGAAKEAVVLRGYCDALFTPRAFGAIMDVAAQFPEDKEGAIVRPDIAREQIFAQLYRRLQALHHGAVVVLEDLHWADEATLDFVRFFCRRISHTRCLLLATYRDEEVGASRLLNRALGDLAGPHVSRQRLLPLSTAAVVQLASEAGQDGDRLFTLTGGNPFLVRELLSSPADDVPGTVRDSMVARLARCSTVARKVCDVVALLPGRAEIELVTQVLGDVGEAVDETIARGVILHEHGTLSYRHELARRAVENVLPPGQSRALHAQILGRLRECHADIARLVHHARCAGDRPAVLALAPQAAKRAIAVGAHREAAAQYAAALAFADELPAIQRGELLEQYAYECYLTSRIKDAIESATAGLTLWREQGDLAAQGRLLRFLSRQYWFLGDREKAERFASDAIEILSALPPSHDLAMAYSNRSQLGMLKGEVSIAVEYGEKAIALARVLSDVEVESHALNNVGAARLTEGDLKGVAELERSLQLALAKNLHEHAARAYVNLSVGAMRLQDVEPARRYLAEGLAYCEEREIDSWTTYFRVYQARFDLERGAWDRAEATATRLLKDSTITAITRIPALVILAQIHLRRGLPGVDAWLEEALALALPTGEVQRIGPVAAARAEAAWFRQDRPAVIREADQGLTWAMATKEAWTAGELLFWKSRVAPIAEIPAWLPAAYRFAIAGDWKAAAKSFAYHELPYERALLLAQGDRDAVALSHQLLTQLGARAAIVALSHARQTA